MSQTHMRRIVSRMNIWIYKLKTYCQSKAFFRPRACVMLATVMLMTMPLVSMDAQASSAAEAAAAGGVEEVAEQQQNVFPKATFEESVTEMMLTHRMLEQDDAREKVLARFPERAKDLEGYINVLQVLDRQLVRYIDIDPDLSAPTFIELWQGCQILAEKCPEWVSPKLWRAYVASRLYDMATGELELPVFEGDTRGNLGHLTLMKFPITLNFSGLRTSWHPEERDPLRILVQSETGLPLASFAIPDMSIASNNETFGPRMRMIYVAALFNHDAARYAVAVLDGLTSTIVDGVSARAGDIEALAAKLQGQGAEGNVLRQLQSASEYAGQYSTTEGRRLTALHHLRLSVFGVSELEAKNAVALGIKSWIASRLGALRSYGLDEDVDADEVSGSAAVSAASEPVEAGAKFAYDILQGRFPQQFSMMGLSLVPTDMSVTDHNQILGDLLDVWKGLVGLTEQAFAVLDKRLPSQEAAAAGGASPSSGSSTEGTRPDAISFDDWLVSKTNPGDYGKIHSVLLQFFKMAVGLMTNINLSYGDTYDVRVFGPEQVVLDALEHRRAFMGSFFVKVNKHPGIIKSLTSAAPLGHDVHQFTSLNLEILRYAVLASWAVLQHPRNEINESMPNAAKVILLMHKLEILEHVIGKVLPRKLLNAQMKHKTTKANLAHYQQHILRRVAAATAADELFDDPGFMTELSGLRAAIVASSHDVDVTNKEDEDLTDLYSRLATALGIIIDAQSKLLAKAVAAHAQAMKNLS